jgi:cytochrome c
LDRRRDQALREKSRSAGAGMRTAIRRLAAVAASLLAATAASADGDAGRGEKRFEDCAACHSVAAGQNGVGPSLHGVFDRKAGTLDDFRFSPAMKRSGITWDAKTLDTFLTDPQKVVPANRMPYAGLPDAADRADLIAYLLRATK